MKCNWIGLFIAKQVGTEAFAIENFCSKFRWMKEWWAKCCLLIYNNFLNYKYWAPKKKKKFLKRKQTTSIIEKWAR